MKIAVTALAVLVGFGIWLGGVRMVVIQRIGALPEGAIAKYGTILLRLPYSETLFRLTGGPFREG